jgi:hypothetical protein
VQRLCNDCAVIARRLHIDSKAVFKRFRNNCIVPALKCQRLRSDCTAIVRCLRNDYVFPSNPLSFASTSSLLLPYSFSTFTKTVRQRFPFHRPFHAFFSSFSYLNLYPFLLFPPHPCNLYHAGCLATCCMSIPQSGGLENIPKIAKVRDCVLFCIELR